MDEELDELRNRTANVEKEIEKERQARLAAEADIATIRKEIVEIKKDIVEIKKRTAEANARYVKAIEETKIARLELCQLLCEEAARLAKSYSTCRDQHTACVRYGCV
jgi:chromosome segregation ATPase